MSKQEHTRNSKEEKEIRKIPGLLSYVYVVTLGCISLIAVSLLWILREDAGEKTILVTLLLCLIPGISLLSGFFVFRPVQKRIKNTIHELDESGQQAAALARKLSLVNVSLEQSLKDLKDANAALDHATILAKTDKYGVINYVNDKFCEISKYSREELIGNRFHLLSGHYHSRSFFDNMWETISSGKIWNNEIKNRAKDGSFFWLDATIVPVMGRDHTPVQYIAIYTDITQRFKQSINEQKIRSASLMEGQEKERKKMARELHDGLGQMLTALKFHLEAIKGASNKKEKENLEEIKKLLFETIAEVRKISFNLMPSVLSDYGVVSAIKHLSDQVSRSSSTRVLFENNSEIQRLEKRAEINLYRIVQEALNNAIKYAEADEVKVSLDNDGRFIHLMIADNGKGFRPSGNGINLEKIKTNSGNGIQNIQERTSLVDGEFRIETAPGKGTKIMIKVPLAGNREKDGVGSGKTEAGG